MTQSFQYKCIIERKINEQFSTNIGGRIKHSSVPIFPSRKSFFQPVLAFEARVDAFEIDLFITGAVGIAAASNCTALFFPLRATTTTTTTTLPILRGRCVCPFLPRATAAST